MKNKFLKQGIILCTLLGLFSSTSVSAWNEWIYIVQHGDQVGFVSERELGSAWAYFDEIRRLNPAIVARDYNMHWLIPGEPLWMPEGRFRQEQRLREEARQREEAAARQRELDAAYQRRVDYCRTLVSKFDGLLAQYHLLNQQGIDRQFDSAVRNAEFSAQECALDEIKITEAAEKEMIQEVETFSEFFMKQEEQREHDQREIEELAARENASVEIEERLLEEMAKEEGENAKLKEENACLLQEGIVVSSVVV